ncbi:MAG: hypothetical protein K9M03_02075 [Kiritimatiellales bacterium]|nr:hypothetical protein [Kiritimatiellales bacterium]
MTIDCDIQRGIRNLDEANKKYQKEPSDENEELILIEILFCMQILQVFVTGRDLQMKQHVRQLWKQWMNHVTYSQEAETPLRDS